MAQHIKALATQLNNLSSIPQIYIYLEKGGN